MIDVGVQLVLGLLDAASIGILRQLEEKKKWEIFFKTQATRRQYLQLGDVVEASIRSADGRLDLGTQRNCVVAGDDHG